MDKIIVLYDFVDKKFREAGVDMSKMANRKLAYEVILETYSVAGGLGVCGVNPMVDLGMKIYIDKGIEELRANAEAADVKAGKVSKPTDI